MSTKTDQLPNVKNRDQKRVTPRHQRSSGDQLRPVGAQAKINSKINPKITGGTPC